LPYEPVREDLVTTTTSSSLATPQARFLAVISHELRTPLTTIASFTESLDAGDLAAADRSLALTAVRRNTERMLTLVDDLMVVSRLQTGGSVRLIFDSAAGAGAEVRLPLAIPTD
jgi:signal transduction histidine kinase